MMNKLVVCVSAVIIVLLFASATIYYNMGWILLRFMEKDGTVVVRSLEPVSLVPLLNKDSSEVAIISWSEDLRTKRKALMKEIPCDLGSEIEDWLLSAHRDAFLSKSDFVPRCCVSISDKAHNRSCLITIVDGLIFVYDVDGTNQYIRIGSSKDRKVFKTISAVMQKL